MNYNFFVQEIKDSKTKSLYTRNVLEKLPKWFGNKSALNEYVLKVANLPYWAALCNNKCLGFFPFKPIMPIREKLLYAVYYPNTIL